MNEVDVAEEGRVRGEEVGEPRGREATVEEAINADDDDIAEEVRKGWEEGDVRGAVEAEAGAGARGAGETESRREEARGANTETEGEREARRGAEEAGRWADDELGP